MPWHSLWHTGDSVYAVQSNLYNVYYGEWEEEDYEIAEKISNYWVKFIKYGNPNGDGFI